MKSLSESHKLQIADAFCKALVTVLMINEPEKGKLTDEEKNKVFQDIEVLKSFVNGQKWQELVIELKSVEHLEDRKKIVSDGIQTIINAGINSPLVKEWVMLHLKEDYLNVLEVSLRRFNNYILPITIEIPNFIDLEETFVYKKVELKRRDFMVKSILENIPSSLKSSSKVTVVKYDIIDYPDDVPEIMVEKNNQWFDSKILNPFN